MKSDWMSSFIGLVSESIRLPNGTVEENLPVNARDARDGGLIPGSGRSPGVGNGNLLQYSCLESSMDRGTWQATVHGVTKSWTWLKWLSTHIRVHQETETRAGILVVKVGKSEVAQSCLTLCNPMGCSIPGSTIHGIFQARVLEWVAISFSRRSSRPRDWTWISRIAGRCFTVWVTREAFSSELNIKKWLAGIRKGKRQRQATGATEVRMIGNSDHP